MEKVFVLNIRNLYWTKLNAGYKTLSEISHHAIELPGYRLHNLYSKLEKKLCGLLWFDVQCKTLKLHTQVRKPWIMNPDNKYQWKFSLIQFIQKFDVLLELVSKELKHFGVIACLFRQIGGHSSRFVFSCSFWRLFTIKMIKSAEVFPFSFWKIITIFFAS